jgi:hypothetical protein
LLTEQKTQKVTKVKKQLPDPVAFPLSYALLPCAKARISTAIRADTTSRQESYLYG